MRLRWSHCVLYVRDLEEMVDFYTRVLGFEVSDRGPIGPGDGAPQIVFLSQASTDHHQIAFASAGRGEGPSNSHDHIAFRTGSLADVKDLARRLEEDGRASQLGPITHGNAWSIYFKDPEGNGIEVFCDSPWHVPQPQLKPIDLSLSDAEIHAQTEAAFRDEPGFGPIDDYYRSRAEALKE
jgi:catechol 2,3-dioxygenase